ncbi:recombinase family protein [Chelatococcus sp. YT9]|uniref:recombinase family protein n=1 Tax=Chelatococcus sp. TaxID=1953771 RepID=UPI001BCA6EBC|nr:recombinase family protein [Chelatococcus sp. YT9]MBX3556293.1 recombinase family protein [Chelatococcus sp.]
MTQRAAIYAKRQVGVPARSQETRLRESLPPNARRFEIVAILLETRGKARPLRARVLEMAESGAIATLFIPTIADLSESVEEAVHVLGDLRDRGITVINFTGESIEAPALPLNALLHVNDALQRFRKSLLSDRVSDGMHKAKRERSSKA